MRSQDEKLIWALGNHVMLSAGLPVCKADLTLWAWAWPAFTAWQRMGARWTLQWDPLLSAVWSGEAGLTPAMQSTSYRVIHTQPSSSTPIMSKTEGSSFSFQFMCFWGMNSWWGRKWGCSNDHCLCSAPTTSTTALSHPSISGREVSVYDTSFCFNFYFPL